MSLSTAAASFSGVVIAMIIVSKPPSEVPIATIYVDNNRGSHFRTLRDSALVYGRFLKFAASSFTRIRAPLPGPEKARTASVRRVSSWSGVPPTFVSN